MWPSLPPPLPSPPIVGTRAIAATAGATGKDSAGGALGGTAPPPIAPPRFVQINEEIACVRGALAVLAVVERSLHEFDSVNLVTALHRLARSLGPKRSAPAEPTLQKLVERARAALPEFGAQALANIAWSSAVLRLRDGPLLDAIAQRAIGIYDSHAPMQVQELANTAWAFATLRAAHGGLLVALSAAATGRLSPSRRDAALLPQHLSTMAWSLATLAWQDAPLLDAIAGAATELAGDFGPQALANTAWAFAHLAQAQRAPLYAVLAAVAVAKLGSFKPRECANMLWAFATLAFRDDLFLEVVSSKSILEIGRFPPQDMSTTVWSFATLLVRDVPLLDAVAGEAAPQMARGHVDFSAQSLANCAWAFATLQAPRRALFRAIQDAYVACAPEFVSQALANVAWSFATLDLRPQEAFLAALEAETLRKLGAFLPSELAIACWSFARLSVSRALFEAIAAEARRLTLSSRMERFTASVVLEGLAVGAEGLAWAHYAEMRSCGLRPCAFGVSALLSSSEGRRVASEARLLRDLSQDLSLGTPALLAAAARLAASGNAPAALRLCRAPAQEGSASSAALSAACGGGGYAGPCMPCPPWHDGLAGIHVGATTEEMSTTAHAHPHAQPWAQHTSPARQPAKPRHVET